MNEPSYRITVEFPARFHRRVANAHEFSKTAQFGDGPGATLGVLDDLYVKEIVPMNGATLYSTAKDFLDSRQ